jgi:formyltetrahydrofolate-dependent phosphoribosylglycinamide formyltransferase
VPDALKRLAILSSGSGTNLQSILDYFESLGAAAPVLPVLVASDRPGAMALERARRREIATAVIDPSDGNAIVALLDAHRITLIALAGYLKFVPTVVTRRWRGAIVNIHPALLPKFGGPGMYGRHVHEAVLAAHEHESGATAHFVDDAYDRGPAIARARVPVEATDDAASLAARVLIAEHALFPRTIHAVALGIVSLNSEGHLAVQADFTRDPRISRSAILLESAA